MFKDNILKMAAHLFLWRILEGQ